MKIIAHRGNNLHCPENTYTSMISAYTSGADVLEFDVQLTKDHQLVVSHDGTINRLCNIEGDPVNVYDRTVDELRSGDYDFGAYFNPNNHPDFEYYNGRSVVKIEIFSDLLDQLPQDIDKFIEIKHDSTDTEEKRTTTVNLFADLLIDRNCIDNVIVYSKDKYALRLLKQRIPHIRFAVFDWELSPDEQVELLLAEGADALLTDLESILKDGQLTPLALKIKALHSQNKVNLGVIMYPYRKPGIFYASEFEILKDMSFVWGVSTDTCIQFDNQGQWENLSALIQPSYPWIKETFDGTVINEDRFALGYAKNNPYAYIQQNNGIHIELDPYTGPLPLPPHNEEVTDRLNKIEHRLLYVEKTWPFYSGGGLGLVLPVKGDFSAEVDYEVEKTMTKAQTLEMAVTNIEPGRHRFRRPKTNRHADPFFDPHGCPPYVGVEHDENDGYRINWNKGGDYANNRYGLTTGNGQIPQRGTLRLDRKGDHFSAYYRNEIDAKNWICVGVIENQSLNQSVYLRCVAKRWLKESNNTESGYLPVQDNTIIFKNLIISKPLEH